jgi:hypothetical protein
MWPFSKKLEDVLLKTKKVRVRGVPFVIRKIDASDYMAGSKVMLQAYDTYRLEKPDSELALKNLDKIKEHFRDVFMAAIIEPKIHRKEKKDNSFLVDNLFTDWGFASELYEEIISYTYGKKKSKLSSLLEAI